MMISGSMKSPEDFIVREVLSSRFSRSYMRTSSGVKPVSGRHTLFLLEKKNMNTKDAIAAVAQELGISAEAIGYAGLKDKNAVTYQHITVRDAPDVGQLRTGNITLTFISKTNKKLSPGDLAGNNFEITLHDCKNLHELPAALKKISKGIPNYFGPQRFGVRGDNHVNGKMILVNKELPKNTSKEQAKFFIHAYQSWLFNRLLSLAKGTALPVPGYDTKPTKALNALLKKDGISLKDFRIDRLRIMCRGSMREAMIKPDISYSINGRTLLLRFFLPKGAYATVVLGAIGKIENPSGFRIHTG